MNSLRAVVNGNYGQAQMYQQKIEERSQAFQSDAKEYAKQDIKDHVAEDAGAVTSRNLLDKSIGR